MIFFVVSLVLVGSGKFEAVGVGVVCWTPGMNVVELRVIDW